MGEWVQLRAGSTARTELERGFWYRVEARETAGFFRVVGPNDIAVPVEIGLVRVVDRQPDTVTRIQETEVHTVRPGESAPGLSYYGICPRGHWIPGLRGSDIEVQCPDCKRAYKVEDESP